ncbi:MAG TPA: di-heme oxidoredictase family protein [Candidatus Latescibacteria bacterium]|nr:di-heme oxidoredictase family protein [Candidatus Latescibacterota bacterium]MDP7635473.1 di-heme oxidoredictase family protein [Candidatus Latescibacterota bacterium]HJN29021.1 di-heme oxidoredictase family protein [Candidatus Latescibacterota bacterium]
MRKTTLGLALAVAVLGGCGDDGTPTGPEQGAELDPALSGGAATVFDEASTAFENPVPGLDAMQMSRFLAGDAAFEAVFVTAPAQINGGLGPVFNQTSCVGCHGRDGRGQPDFGDTAPFVGSSLMRVSLPGASIDPPGAPVPVPGFGGQIGDRAIFGVEPEARVEVTYRIEEGRFADGQVYRLAHPTYDLVDPYTDLPAGVLTSPRMAPPVFGGGLLEAVPASEILALADPGDADGDGISGRVNYVFDVAGGELVVGRFGRKANNPNLLQQTAGAYNEDMGITSPYFSRESAHGQKQADGLIDEPEITQEILDDVVFYLRTLAVPARRLVNDPVALRGEEIFADVGCGGCHTPTLVTGSHEIAALSNQIIHPYTDFMLHDMGDDLADDRPDYDADGREWRTPPLWGIGLTQTVSGVPAYLHDGRASTLLEAVMFHGGEAEATRDAVQALTTEDRMALVVFLKSL